MLISRFVPVVLLAAGFVTATANAGTVGFSGCTFGGFTGSVSEGVFTYSKLSGSLFCDSDGNPGNDMEGMSSSGGGVLDIVRNDVAGGLFTFSAADVRFESGQAVGITFVGLLNSVTVATDILTTTANTLWTNRTPINLNGVSINELRVTLPGPAGGAADVDNINLTPGVAAAVPEPSSLMLILSGGFAGLVLMWRRIPR
jgi:PEP-CTERM motif-containing protein